MKPLKSATLPDPAAAAAAAAAMKGDKSVLGEQLSKQDDLTDEAGE